MAKKWKPRDYQIEAVEAVLKCIWEEPKESPLAVLPTGCHAKGQGILMFDGTIKKVEDVVVGDLLMGPDSTPRRVLNLCRGRQEMRRITPNRNYPAWVVNKDHILSLRKGQGIYGIKDPEFINIPVKDYEVRSAWYRRSYKLHRTGVDFTRGRDLPLPARLIGIWLGDGHNINTNRGVQIEVAYGEEEICGYLSRVADSVGDLVARNSIGERGSYVVRFGRKALRHLGSNTVAIMRNIGLGECGVYDKFIPREYKTASRRDRLELLAGIIDTDGHLTTGSYEIATASDTLAEDILFVARSLGLNATSTVNAATAVKGGKLHYNNRIHISGHIDEIPVLLERKKAPPRRMNKDPLRHGFTIERLPEDDYYGFAIDGDHLYLLDDFTVTHNTGKAPTLAWVVKAIMMRLPHVRITIMSHVAEILEQDAEALSGIWPQAPYGVYSASLGAKQAAMPITIAGIQSAVKNIEAFGKQHILIVDEAHLIPPNDEASYQKFITGLKKKNPNLIVIGFTATPFRQGQGMLTNGKIFTKIAVDFSGMEKFNWFIDQGYLMQIIPKRTNFEFDRSKLRKVAGEFNLKDVQAEVSKEGKTLAALQEAVQVAHDREHILVFCAGIDHIEQTVSILEAMGETVTFVHSKVPGQRKEAVRRFKESEVRWLVNDGVLTTGFDYAGVDCIVILRPLQSVVLYIQICGRGTRPFYIPGFDLDTVEGRLASIAASPKHNCLLLDFGGAVQKLGPINDPKIPKPKGKGDGEAPVKICPKCDTYNHAAARKCVGITDAGEPCDMVFEFTSKIEHSASTAVVVAGRDPPEMHWFPVSHVEYNPFTKPFSLPMMKVSYHCGLRCFFETICIEHPTYAGKVARDWWRARLPEGYDPPKTTHEGHGMVNLLKEPTHVYVQVNLKYPKVSAVSFDGTTPIWEQKEKKANGAT